MCIFLFLFPCVRLYSVIHTAVPFLKSLTAACFLSLFFKKIFQPPPHPPQPTPSLAIFSPTTAWLNLALHTVPVAAEKPEVCKVARPVEDRCSGNSRTLCCPLIPPHGKRRLKKLLCFKHSTVAPFAPPGGAQPHGRACFCYELVGN